MKDAPAPRKTVLARPGPATLRNLADTLRDESWGAALLALGALAALIWANSPAGASYREISETVIGPHWGELDLTVAEWAQDGLLTIFFFTVGLELKRELVVGELRRISTAIVPVVAAIGGMAVPALVYAAINAAQPGGSMHGWAIPVATDIAFAVAVLGAFGRSLPAALRAFLLTLAVADDLLGIVVIAVFYAAGIQLIWLVGALGAIAVYAWLVRRARPPAILACLIVVAAWYCMHRSGVHATIAGVLAGFATPALMTRRRRPDELIPRTDRYEHWWRPISAAFAVPVFALFAAGVELNPAALRAAALDPTAQGVVAGLVIGKPVGIFLTTFALVALSRAALDPAIRWADLYAVATVGGIGFTVSLLIGKLAFAPDSAHEAAIKAGVIFGSLAAALIGAALLIWRAAWHRRHPDPPTDPQP